MARCWSEWSRPLKLSRVDFERKLRMAGSAQGLRDFGVDTWDRLLSA